MFREAGILFLYAETPLSPGSGVGVGDVDLAIQREKHTGYPIIQATGVKGAMRDVLARRDNSALGLLFGPEPGGPPKLAGVLSFTEARLLLFPVWSLVGVFAWVTCPAVLRRFAQDLALIGTRVDAQFPDMSDISPAEDQALMPEGASLATGEGLLVLEDTTLRTQEDRSVTQIARLIAAHAVPNEFAYWAAKMQTDLAIVNDELFGDFVRHGTEVISRVQIGDTGTVAEGPWEEEYLPAETLLYSLVLTADPRLRARDSTQLPPELQGGPRSVLGYLKAHLDNTLHAWIGGRRTLGRGLVSVRFHRAEDWGRPAASPED